jgi:hypothetical protein
MQFYRYANKCNKWPYAPLSQEWKKNNLHTFCDVYHCQLVFDRPSAHFLVFLIPLNLSI